MSTQLDPLSLSADLLYEIKTEGKPEERQNRLATLERGQLRRALSDRDRRLAFWLNCYNAYVHLLCERTPELLESGTLERWKFYARDRIPIAGVQLSLADIEHGMLRGSKHPWGFGYLPRPFPSPFEREFRLEDVDPRIHFAVTHVDESGPPLTVFSPADVQQQLELTTEWYLEETVTYERSSNTIRVPFLFLWYRGDFGGKRGVLEFLREYGALSEDANPRIEYGDDERTNCGIDLESLRE